MLNLSRHWSNVPNPLNFRWGILLPFMDNKRRFGNIHVCQFAVIVVPFRV